MITDHKPLTTIFNPESAIPTLAAARMQRWAIILSAYTYDIEFKRSGDHGNADALSRLPRKVDHTTHEEVKYFSYLDELPVTAKDISRATLKDPVLARVHEFVANGWPNYVQDEDVRPFFTRRDELTVEQGCILWGLRVIIPPKFRSRLLDDLHEQHLGICRMKGLARSYLWWPGLDKDIECLVNACTTCLSVRNAPPKAPLKTWEWPTRVWQRLHIDYAELKGQHMLILVDSHSKWVEVYPMKTTTTTKTLDILRRLFSSYGIPEEIVSDNGPQFTSSEFQDCMTKNGIKHTKVPPYHPASNGAAERTVQTVKRALTKQLLDPNQRKQKLSIHHKLANFLITYRNTPQATTGRTPAELFLKRQPRTRFSLLKPNLATTVEDKQGKQRMFHDKGRVKERTLKVNQKVRVKSHQNNLEKWVSGKVVKVCGPRTYIVQVYKNGRNRFVHIDHVLPSQEESQMVVPDAIMPETSNPVHVPVTNQIPQQYEQEKVTNQKQNSESSGEIPQSLDQKHSNQANESSPGSPGSSTQVRRYPQRVRNPPKRLDL